jgi:hypothetical protein
MQAQDRLYQHEGLQSRIMYEGGVIRAHNTGQNLNTSILVFLVYDTGIPGFPKQKCFSINFDNNYVQ